MSGFWNRCAPALTDHIVITEWCGSPDGLRVVIDDGSLTVDGRPLSGALVIPLREVGQPESVPPSGLRFLLPVQAEQRAAMGLRGRPAPPCAFTLGALSEQLPVFVVESLLDGWAIHRCSGMPVLVTCSDSALAGVARNAVAAKFSQSVVLVPRRGGEAGARELAREIGASLVRLPHQTPDGHGAAQFAMDNGDQALRALLSDPRGPLDGHPGSRFVELHDGPARQPNWVVPGYIEEGVVCISGTQGIGKTSSLVPLAMTIAGLHAPDDALAPTHWRHVIYWAEDSTQVARILAAVRSLTPSLSFDLIEERFHVVDASRMPADELSDVGDLYREQFSRDIDGIVLRPLVVLDTKAATIALENENDNAMASHAVAMLKERLRLPVWLIGHVPKSASSSKDTTPSMRGASGFEADANQTLVLHKRNDGHGYLTITKARFKPRTTELRIESQWVTLPALDQFEKSTTMDVVFGRCVPYEPPAPTPGQSDDPETRLDRDVIEAVEKAWAAGDPLNRTGLRSVVSGSRDRLQASIERLLESGRLYEVQVPAAVRLNSNSRAFLVALTAAEAESYLAGGSVPPEKLVVPKSWCRDGKPKTGAGAAGRAGS